MVKRKEWTQIDVTKEVRDRLQKYKYGSKKRYKSVNEIIMEWLEKAERKK